MISVRVINANLSSDMRTLIDCALNQMLEMLKRRLVAIENTSLTVKTARSYENVERITLPVYCILKQI